MTIPTITTLRGKCALITGSTQGLGLAAAEQFAAAGCHVVLNGLGEAAAIEQARERISRTHGVRVEYHGTNLRDPAGIERLMADVLQSFGAVDILVNNAVVRHTAPIDQFPVSQWDEAIAVNLSAAFHTIRLALPSMRARRWGRIINVSSIYGWRGAANRVSYVTTKTALIGLTRAVALETVGDHITCNAVCPGTTDTPLHRQTIDRMVAEGLTREDAERRFFAGKQPSGRFIPAHDVAALMLFLCSDEAANITGAALPVDAAWAAM